MRLHDSYSNRPSLGALLLSTTGYLIGSNTRCHYAGLSEMDIFVLTFMEFLNCYFSEIPDISSHKRGMPEGRFKATEKRMNIVVGVSDMKVSKEAQSVLATYSLGSCIGIAIYDSVARVGGILHYMLPESGLDPVKAQKNPFMFADTGIPLLFKASYVLGAKKQNIKVIVAGGAQMLDSKGVLNIGKRNEIAVRKMLYRNNVIIDHIDVGGTVNRTIHLSINSGRACIKVSGRGESVINL